MPGWDLQLKVISFHLLLSRSEAQFGYPGRGKLSSSFPLTLQPSCFFFFSDPHVIRDVWVPWHILGWRKIWQSLNSTLVSLWVSKEYKADLSLELSLERFLLSASFNAQFMSLWKCWGKKAKFFFASFCCSANSFTKCALLCLSFQGQSLVDLFQVRGYMIVLSGIAAPLLLYQRMADLI